MSADASRASNMRDLHRFFAWIKSFDLDQIAKMIFPYRGCCTVNLSNLLNYIAL